MKSYWSYKHTVKIDMRNMAIDYYRNKLKIEQSLNLNSIHEQFCETFKGGVGWDDAKSKPTIYVLSIVK